MNTNDSILVDFAKERARQYELRRKRLTELERMIHCCEITINSLIDIQDPQRMQFSNMVEKYKNLWKYEMDSIRKRFS